MLWSEHGPTHTPSPAGMLKVYWVGHMHWLRGMCMAGMREGHRCTWSIAMYTQVHVHMHTLNDTHCMGHGQWPFKQCLLNRCLGCGYHISTILALTLPPPTSLLNGHVNYQLLCSTFKHDNGTNCTGNDPDSLCTTPTHSIYVHLWLHKRGSEAE